MENVFNVKYNTKMDRLEIPKERATHKVFKFLENLTSVNFQHILNAKSSITSTLSGITTFCMLARLNAASPILVNPSLAHFCLLEYPKHLPTNSHFH